MRRLDQIRNVLNRDARFIVTSLPCHTHKQLKAIQPRLVYRVPFNRCNRDLLIGQSYPIQKGNI